MPYTIFSSPVNAPLTTVWQVMLEKIENPSATNKMASGVQIIERFKNGVLRQMNALDMEIKERITIDETKKIIRHTLVDNPLFVGKIMNTVIPPTQAGEFPILTYAVDWEPYNEQGRKTDEIIKNKLIQAAQNAVLGLKMRAESLYLENGKVLTENYLEHSRESFPGKTADLVKCLFSRGEAFDSEGFTEFFTDTPVYQFGNFDICFDKPSIQKSAEKFFLQIEAVYHDIKMIWEVGDVVFVEMNVTYWRKDGSVVTLPCHDIFRLEGDKFSELRIFMDVNPVFDPSISVAETASVFTGKKGYQIAPSNTMKEFFTRHPEGITRINSGFAPKWSKFIMSNNMVSTSEQLQAISELSELVLQEKWEEAKNYLTDDILYKVGSAEAMYGKQAVVDFLSGLFKTTAKLDGHNVRKIWNEPGIVTIEMDAKYTRLEDKKKLTIACCDIYRMQGNQVSEWRVYADMAPFLEE